MTHDGQRLAFFVYDSSLPSLRSGFITPLALVEVGIPPTQQPTDKEQVDPDRSGQEAIHAEGARTYLLPDEQEVLDLTTCRDGNHSLLLI